MDGGSSDESLKIVDEFKGRTGASVVKLIDSTRNMGYVRNLGAKSASGQLLFFTNSDATFPCHLLQYVSLAFGDPDLQALSGSTVSYGGGALAFAAYFCFDRIRSFMANRMGRFSPSGNFLAVRAELFWQLGGFPLANVNEDGILGQRISRYCREHRLKARFNLDLKTGHYAKRFKRGPLKTLLF